MKMRSEFWTIRSPDPEYAEREGSPENYKERVSEPLHGGVLNGKAVSLPPPEYPAIARSAHASGSVAVAITVDEEGNVIEARAVSGHPLLQAASVSAAREAKFAPTRMEGVPVRVSGVVVYNFVAQ
jgi:TonB family protein